MSRAFYLILISIIFLIQPASMIAGGEPFILISAEEAREPDAPATSPLFEVSLPIGGPLIEVVNPQIGKSYKSPIPIEVRFIPKTGEIDMETLKVEYLKFISINLTSRVSKYVTKEGINVPDAELPSGKHTIRLTIGDKAGNVAKQVFTVEVL